MRQFLGSKLTIVALIIMVLTLVTGVTWASTNNQTASSPVEIQAQSLNVIEGGIVQIAGDGFVPGETVLFQIFRGSDQIAITIQGGTANEAGAFLASVTLPDSLTASDNPNDNVFTVRALITGGQQVASTPLIVTKKKITTK